MKAWRTMIAMTAGTAVGLLLTAALHAAAGASSTSLVDAAKSGDANAVRTLLQQKAVDVNATAVDGSTALHWAVQRGDARMVESLIRAGANARAINRYGVPPLGIAAVDGNSEILRLLLDGGADPNIGL